LFIAQTQTIVTHERHLLNMEGPLKIRLAHAALSAAADAIVITDREGVILWVNPAFEQLSGYTLKEIRGQKTRLFQSGKQGGEFYKELWKTVLEGRVWRSEIVNKYKNGTLYDEEMGITPIRNAKGEVTHFVAIKRDVTGRKKFEEGLERLVAERTAQLRESMNELEHFSYTLVHDLRAPLRAMRGFGEILKEEASGQLGESEMKLLSRIITATDRMDALITDSLDYNKLVLGHFELSRVEVEPLLNEMLDTYPEFQTENARITVVSPIAPVLANKAGLTQCFSNLLNNAIKYRKKDQQAVIVVRSEDRDDQVRIWFEDNGIGIAPEHQELVFQMFRQLHKGYEGTGIGLALVAKAARRMNGKCGLESMEGVGSRFWLEFKKV